MKKMYFIMVLLVFIPILILAQDFEGFETGDFSAYEWQLSGNANWFVTNNSPYEGNYCAQGGDINDSQATTLEISRDITDNGAISFYWKVDSESNWDYLRFYLDGNQIQEICGTVGWTQVSTNVSTGVHIFKWEYSKDGSVSTGLDTGWIDNIVFPPTVSYDIDLAAMSISGAGNVNQGDSEIYDIVVKNVGNIDQGNYTVRLMREGNIEISSFDITDNLAPGEQITHHLVWNIPADEPEGATYLYGEVILDNDENPANNTTGNLNVQIFQSGTLQITVGNGTDLEERIPMCFFYNNSLTETMYYPSELNSGGMIEGISYENNFVSTLHGKHTKVWIGETTLTDFSAGWIPSYQLTSVFDSNINYPEGQNTIMIDFQTPYYYEGGILVLMVQRPWDDNNYSPNDRFYITMTSGFPDRTIYNRDNDEEYSPSNPPEEFFLYDQFPNTTFYFSFGDLGNVEGYVLDEDENPLQGALVDILGTSSFTYSDQDGFFQFSNIPVGIQSFEATIFGYSPQTIEAEVIENQTIQVQFNMIPLGTVNVSGHVAGSDFPESGLEGATVTLTGFEDYEVITDANGDFEIPDVYTNITYEMNITHEIYETYTDEVTVEGQDLDLGTLILNEITMPPGNLQAVQNPEETEVELTWNMPGIGLSEFRYDDDIVVSQIGFSNTPSNAVFGASHFHNAVIQEVHWLLTSAWGSHTQAKIFIFGLDNDGLPDSNQLLHQSALLPNADNEWNTYILAESINVPDGFFIGVNTPGIYTGIGLDDGADEPWEFQAGTQMAIESWSSGDWLDIGDIAPQFQKNMMIRAYGIDFGEIDRNREITSSYSSKQKHVIVNPAFDREFESFNVYRFNEYDHDDPENWDLIASAITDTFYTDTDWNPLPIGIYQFAVTSVHTNNVESVPAFSSTIYKSTVGIDDNQLTIDDFRLTNFPNPFSSSTTIYFNLRNEQNQQNEQTSLEIYNIKGQKVNQLRITNYELGINEVVWDGQDESGKQVNSGIYFYKLKSGKYSATKKMILIK